MFNDFFNLVYFLEKFFFFGLLNLEIVLFIVKRLVYYIRLFWDEKYKRLSV